MSFFPLLPPLCPFSYAVKQRLFAELAQVRIVFSYDTRRSFPILCLCYFFFSGISLGFTFFFLKFTTDRTDYVDNTRPAASLSPLFFQEFGMLPCLSSFSPSRYNKGVGRRSTSLVSRLRWTLVRIRSAADIQAAGLFFFVLQSAP